MKNISNVLVKVKRNYPKSFYYFDENGIYKKNTKEEIITLPIQGVRPIGNANYRYNEHPTCLTPEHSLQREARANKVLEKMNPGDIYDDFIQLYEKEPIRLFFCRLTNHIIRKDKHFYYYFNENGVYSKCGIDDKESISLIKSKYELSKRIMISSFEVPKEIPDDILLNYLKVGQTIFDYTLLVFRKYFEMYQAETEPFVLEWNGTIFAYDPQKESNSNE